MQKVNEKCTAQSHSQNVFVCTFYYFTDGRKPAPRFCILTLNQHKFFYLLFLFHCPSSSSGSLRPWLCMVFPVISIMAWTSGSETSMLFLFSPCKGNPRNTLQVIFITHASYYELKRSFFATDLLWFFRWLANGPHLQGVQFKVLLSWKLRTTICGTTWSSPTVAMAEIEVQPQPEIAVLTTHALNQTVM